MSEFLQVAVCLFTFELFLHFKFWQLYGPFQIKLYDALCIFMEYFQNIFTRGSSIPETFGCHK